MTEPKRVYVAATARNDGKTTVSVGLISVLRDRLGAIGFIKPVGQRYRMAEGVKVDEDSFLVARVWGGDAPLGAMSPIAIESGFTRQYIDRGDNTDLKRRIRHAFERVAAGKDLVVVEGTGHAGVGSVVGLSNAQVARMLRSKVLLVTEGGIGRPIDEILLNRALFDAAGVSLLGVIINKVLPEKYDEVAHYVTKSLAAHGIRALGFLPREPVLASATVRQIWQDIGGEIINGEEAMDASVAHTVVGAMSPHRLLDSLTDPRTLLVTPGDREDVVVTAMIASHVGRPDGFSLSGIILTGGVRPHQTVLALVRQTRMPVILINEDTYQVASRIHDQIVKMQAADTEKIALARDLVSRHVDVERLLAEATPLPA